MTDNQQSIEHTAASTVSASSTAARKNSAANNRYSCKASWITFWQLIFKRFFEQKSPHSIHNSSSPVRTDVTPSILKNKTKNWKKNKFEKSKENAYRIETTTIYTNEETKLTRRIGGLILKSKNEIEIEKKNEKKSKFAYLSRWSRSGGIRTNDLM